MGSRPLVFDDKQTYLLGYGSKEAPSPFGYKNNCLQHKNSLYLYRLFTELTRYAWSSDNNFMENTSQRVRWSSDGRDLAVGPEYMFSTTHKEYPCIIGIKLAPLRYSPIKGSGNGDLLGTAPDMSYNMYGRSCEGGLSIIHFALEPGQAVDMGDGTQEYFSVFSPAIRKEFGFIQLGVESREALSSPTPSEIYGKSRYTSIVNMQFMFELRWNLMTESVKLREILFDSGLETTGRYTIIEDEQK